MKNKHLKKLQENFNSRVKHMLIDAKAGADIEERQRIVGLIPNTTPFDEEINDDNMEIFLNSFSRFLAWWGARLLPHEEKRLSHHKMYTFTSNCITIPKDEKPKNENERVAQMLQCAITETSGPAFHINEGKASHYLTTHKNIFLAPSTFETNTITSTLPTETEIISRETVPIATQYPLDEFIQAVKYVLNLNAELYTYSEGGQVSESIAKFIKELQPKTILTLSSEDDEDQDLEADTTILDEEESTNQEDTTPAAATVNAS